MQPRQWDFGSAQVKVRIENNQLSWTGFGKTGSSYPLRSVNGVQYEAAGCMSLAGFFVVLVSGGDNPRVQVPKTHKSVQIIQEINAFLDEYHRGQNQPVVQVGSSVAEQLEKLASLKERGILTEQEFAEQKHRLLSK